MNANQRATRIIKAVDELETKFTFEPNKFSVNWSRGGTKPQEFDVLVTSLIWCTDGRILKHLPTVTHSVAFMRALATGPMLFWTIQHCIDSQLHMQKPIKVYKNFGTNEAQKACKKLNDRIAALIAPHQRVWIQEDNLAARLMKDALEYLVAFGVMMS